nr:D-alanyl-D-alanine carboxypeptidase [Prevotella sp.]
MYLYNIPKIVFFAFALTVLSGCKEKKVVKTPVLKQNNSIAIDKQLPHRIDSCLKRQHPLEKTGIFVYDITAGKPVYGYHENSFMPTASCMKLLTGTAAIHLLGPNYKFDTKLFFKGHVKDHALNGDVTFKAGLDPQFEPTELRLFANNLKKRGISKINGKVWVDLVMNDALKPEPHWYPGDLSVSRFSLFFKGSKRISNELKACLRGQGISFTDSNVIVGRMPKGSKCLFVYRRSMDKVIYRMWKNSSNIQSTSLLYAIGNKVNPKISPDKSGVSYLRRFVLSEIGRKDKWGNIHDGCGLCPYNQLTPSLLVSVLQYGYNDKVIFKKMNAFLPLSGVDGSLHHEMTSGPARGKIRAKTGTLSHPFGISTLSGFCKGQNGHQLCFSIMNSEMSVLDAHVTQRKLCEEFVK